MSCPYLPKELTYTYLSAFYCSALSHTTSESTSIAFVEIVQLYKCFLRLGTYLLHSLGFDQFVASDEFTQDMVTAGKALVQLERSSMRRHKERFRREEQWTGRLGRYLHQRESDCC